MGEKRATMEILARLGRGAAERTYQKKDRPLRESGDKPLISGIVCTYNRLGILKDNLDSLLNQSLARSKYEILVIDNNSSDGTGDYIKELAENHSNLFYFHEFNQGLSHSKNRGIRESRADIIYFMDDDAIAHYYLLETYLRKYEQYPKIDCVGGRVVQRLDFELPRWMRDYYLGYVVLGFDRGSKDIYLDRRHGPVGGNMCYRRSVFEKHGLFDTGLGRVGNRFFANEEEQLIKQVKSRPESCLYTPETYIVHVANRGRSGRRYLLRRAIDKGVSDAHSTESRADHYLRLPLWRKALTVGRRVFYEIREQFFFHGIVLSWVYRVSYILEKLRMRWGSKQ